MKKGTWYHLDDDCAGHYDGDLGEDCRAIRDIASKPLAVDDYVAWCTYTYNSEGGIQTIVTCDSDAKGAFKVYRKPSIHEVASPQILNVEQSLVLDTESAPPPAVKETEPLVNAGSHYHRANSPCSVCGDEN